MTQKHLVTPPPDPLSGKQKALKGLDGMIKRGHIDSQLAVAIRKMLEAMPND